MSSGRMMVRIGSERYARKKSTRQVITVQVNEARDLLIIRKRCSISTQNLIMLSRCTGDAGHSPPALVELRAQAGRRSCGRFSTLGGRCVFRPRWKPWRRPRNRCCAAAADVTGVPIKSRGSVERASRRYRPSPSCTGQASMYESISPLARSGAGAGGGFSFGG